MTRYYRPVPFRDELLADGTVRRLYADGRHEWRRRGPAGVVTWRDSAGRAGVDEPLGGRIVKRRIEPDTVLYGRDVGFGRTTWSDGLLTVNETSLTGRSALAVTAIGAAGLLPALVDPPSYLSPAEEEELRRQQVQQTGSAGNGSESSVELTVGTDPSNDAAWGSTDGGWGEDYG